MSVGRVVRETSEEVHLLYADGLSCSFSKTEYSKLREIRSRPREVRPTRYDSLPVPRRYIDFSPTLKCVFAQVNGDDAAVRAFGVGPWLMSAQYKRANDYTRAARERRALEKET